MKRGVRMPADALARIARATCLPAEFWLDDAIPYPPPLDYLNSRDRATALLTTLSSDDLGWVIEITGEQGKLRRARALWAAAKEENRSQVGGAPVLPRLRGRIRWPLASPARGGAIHRRLEVRNC